MRRLPNASCEDYIFAGGRINRMKRQYMLIQALSYTKNNVKLLIAGPADTKNDECYILNLVHEFHLEDRVKIDIRFLPRQTYANYINHAVAVAYLPFDEDSLGYVSMEAASAEKGLLTTSDSGGILQIVKHGSTGLVASPTPEDLAEALDTLWENRAQTKRFGHAAKELWNSFGVNWKNTLEALLQ